MLDDVESLSCCLISGITGLLEHGVTDNHIIEIQLDDFRNRRLRKPDALLDYIVSKVMDDGNPYYIQVSDLDKLQFVEQLHAMNAPT